MTKIIKLSTLTYEIVEKNQNKKVKAASEITLRTSLKEIPNEYWDKVEVDSDWDREYVESTNVVKTTPNGWTFSGAKEIPMMESHDKEFGWDRRFRNQTDLDNFRKYIADSKKEKIIDLAWAGGQRGGKKAIKELTTNIWLFLPRPNELTQLLKEGNKLFSNGGSGKLKNKETFEYLKSIINSYEIKANIKFISGQEFTLGNWEKWKTNVWGEIEVSEQEAREWQQCGIAEYQQLQQQITQNQQTITSLNQSLAQANSTSGQLIQQNQQSQEKLNKLESALNQQFNITAEKLISANERKNTDEIQKLLAQIAVNPK